MFLCSKGALCNKCYEEAKQIEKTHIKEVYKGSLLLGFISRRSNIIGCAQEIPDGWMISKNKKDWSGNYRTRKLAREALC